jgi:hypothetical protein
MGWFLLEFFFHEGDHADQGAPSWNASNRWCPQPFFLDLTAWVITQIRGCQVGTHPTAGAPSPIFLSLGELDWCGGASALTPSIGIGVEGLPP